MKKKSLLGILTLGNFTTNFYTLKSETTNSVIKLLFSYSHEIKSKSLLIKVKLLPNRADLFLK